MSRTKPLYDLQTLESQGDAARAKLARIDAVVGRAPAVVAARSAHDGVAAAFASVEAELNACQSERHALRDRIAAEEARLYGGRGVPARELEAQKANLDAHRRQLGALDDRALGLMLSRDEAASSVARAKDALDAAVAAAAGNDAKLIEAHGKLEALLAALGPRVAEARGRVAPPDLALYARLRDDPRRNGIAVAKVGGDACGGCGRSLTSAEAQRAAAVLTQCPACGRILHV